ncbi:hypothetical protein DBR00_02480 [Pseudomonas sp. HMWF032]|uniref:hypothetical protein n=1 Tax=Pseudomonas sp. HMWF032 TaxID=2056866 RepID=UPI000D356265|nr:hypothetical protein [Pseudomonas sp. HMWF032]PTS86441.1 hypothetical protein DBR00_02480 [Pseudomonas sp. HMWF032]PTT81370.1 hypothetical protein DBR41_17050 [Pseudomonas sp. HMWF010]
MGGASKIIKKITDHGSKFSIGDRLLKVGVHKEKEKEIDEAATVQNTADASAQILEAPVDADKSKETEDQASATVKSKRGKSALKINRSGGNVSSGGTGANV